MAKTRKRPSVDLRAVCAQTHEDDGVNPKEDRRRKRGEASPSAGRRDRQFCKLVFRTLEDALRSRCNDPALERIRLVGVDPAAGTACLRVAVAIDAPDARVAEASMLRLNGLRGVLRAEIAAAAKRKRTPDLLFHAVPGGEAPHDQ